MTGKFTVQAFICFVRPTLFEQLRVQKVVMLEVLDCLFKLAQERC